LPDRIILTVTPGLEASVIEHSFTTSDGRRAGGEAELMLADLARTRIANGRAPELPNARRAAPLAGAT